MFPVRCIMGPLIQQVCLLTFLILFNACSSVADKQLVVPPDPVVTSAGHDVILPCHLSPQTSAVNMDIRWFKEGEFASPLYLYDGGKVTEGKGYEGRVSVFTQELEKGNISLLLNNVMASERGIYKCHASYMDWIQELPVVLQVKQQGSVPRISMRKHHRVFIQLSCSSENWYPEPDMLWTDSSGKEITSAETERPKQKEGGVLYSITSHMRIGMDQLEGVTCVVISQYQGTKMESKLQMTVAHPCCRPMPLTSGPGSRGCLFIMLVMCKVQTQEEFYMSSLPDRVYISAFMIPVFLGLLCITASVLSLIHQRRVVREKLKPLDDMNTKLKAMDQEVIKKTEELTYKDKLMGITETIPDSVWSLMVDHAVDVTFDPDTAHLRLSLFDDNKSLKFGELNEKKDCENFKEKGKGSGSMKFKEENKEEDTERFGGKPTENSRLNVSGKDKDKKTGIFNRMMKKGQNNKGTLKVEEVGKEEATENLEEKCKGTKIRFNQNTCVLGKEGYDKGTHYWEVDLGKKSQWSVGIAQETEKRDNIQMYPDTGFWSICYKDGELKTVEPSSTFLPIELTPEKLGVFMDYEGGQITFFNVEKKCHIHSFCGKFTKKLYPFFGPLIDCKEELKISPVVKRDKPSTSKNC
ncbi:butyrophilin subfamily 1 member A1-like isoform X3 [Oncorhynchus tshawytscha]|uniref:butyrophilin subfamily 1 member A1-like isoform X3 n=1 Tax=Oncorhynchus tshawytscha TaxID=74940 RepID=UPI001C3C72DC|nr:butyrophilin subfamily 1 member A1-like isoform X3 [Oncorhynchus tshawytscha]